LSTLSDFTITFNKSADLVRCGILLHLFGVVMLWQSRLSIGWLSLLIIALIVSYLITSQLAKRQWISLSRHHSGWILQGKHQQFRFDNLQITFNGGFFLIIGGHTHEKPSKQMVIFLDQLSCETYRLLVLSQRLYP